MHTHTTRTEEATTKLYFCRSCWLLQCMCTLSFFVLFLILSRFSFFPFHISFLPAHFFAFFRSCIFHINAFAPCVRVCAHAFFLLIKIFDVDFNHTYTHTHTHTVCTRRVQQLASKGISKLKYCLSQTVEMIDVCFHRICTVAITHNTWKWW